MLPKVYPGGFAVIDFVKYRFRCFFSPYPVPGLFRVLLKVGIPVMDMPAYGDFTFVHGCIIAILQDGFRKPAEDRFDNV